MTQEQIKKLHELEAKLDKLSLISPVMVDAHDAFRMRGAPKIDPATHEVSLTSLPVTIPLGETLQDFPDLHQAVVSAVGQVVDAISKERISIQKQIDEL